MTSPKAVGEFVPLNGVKSHWGPELAKDRGYFQSKFINYFIILQTTKHGRKSSAGLLARAKEETEEKVISQHPWDPVRVAGQQKFTENLKRYSQTPVPKKQTRIMQPEVICWLTSSSGLMHLKLYFYTVTGRSILLANRGIHPWSVSKLSVVWTCMKLSACNICLAWK